MNRTILSLGFVLGSVALSLRAQTQSDQTLPQFDVASIKENTSITEGGGGTGRLLPGGGLAMKHLPALSYVTMAFQLESYQLVGAPAWMTTTYYDVQAKPPAQATREDTFKMLQALLRDRFQLRFHRGSRAYRAPMGSRAGLAAF